MARPPITPEQINLIAENAVAGATDRQIAEKLNLSIPVVRKYRRQANLVKGEDKKLAPVIVKGTYLEKSPEDKFRQQFLKSDRSKRLKNHLADDDFIYFTDRWSKYHIQMPDMTATEEDAMEKMILLDIRIMYNQKSLRQCHLVQDKLRNEMDNKNELDPENDRDLQIIHTVNAMNAEELELNKQYAILIKEYKDVQKTFNATREQREQNQKIGADTFFDLVKKFQNEDVRRESGRLNELMKISKERKLKELMEPHKYVDGSYDLPILDGKVIKERIKKNKENSNG